jgi:hypothetical protein
VEKKVYHLSFWDVRGENHAQRGFQEEANCVAPSWGGDIFSPGVDCVSEKAVLVIHQAKDTSEKTGLKGYWGFFGNDKMIPGKSM